MARIDPPSSWLIHVKARRPRMCWFCIQRLPTTVRCASGSQQYLEGVSHEGTCLSRAWPEGDRRSSQAGDSGARRRDREDVENHHLRHRPAHPEGRCRDLRAGPHPRPRRSRHRRFRRRRRYRVPPRRSGADLLHLILRQMRVLPARHVLALHDRRLDLRQRDRRNPGGICPHAACRHQSLPDPRRR